MKILNSANSIKPARSNPRNYKIGLVIMFRVTTSVAHVVCRRRELLSDSL